MPLSRRAALRALGAGTLWIAALRHAWAGARIKPGESSALIIVDVQNCFVKGGTLAVEHGDEVVPVLNRLAPAFQNVIMTQDWHPAAHVSFASSHPAKHPFDTVKLAYGTQVLWPDHCVQGTKDAALDADLHVPQAQLILRKGFHQEIDSYSAFMEADRRTPTGLQGYLRQRGIDQLFVAGLATDFCVAWTALDARALGFETYVIEDACRAIDLHGSLEAAWSNMELQGVRRIQSAEIEVI